MLSFRTMPLSLERMPVAVCPQCSKPFELSRAGKIYCSRACNDAHGVDVERAKAAVRRDERFPLRDGQRWQICTGCATEFPVLVDRHGTLKPHPFCEACRKAGKRQWYERQRDVSVPRGTPRCIDCTAAAGPGYLATHLDENGRCPNCAEWRAKRLAKRRGKIMVSTTEATECRDCGAGGVWLDDGGRCPDCRANIFKGIAEKGNFQMDGTRAIAQPQPSPVDVIRTMIARAEAQRAPLLAALEKAKADLLVIDKQVGALEQALGAYQGAMEGKAASGAKQKRQPILRRLVTWAREHDGRVNISEVGTVGEITIPAARNALNKSPLFRRTDTNIYELASQPEGENAA